MKRTAMEKGDAVAIAAFFTEDAVYLDPEGKALEGRAAIEDDPGSNCAPLTTMLIR